LRREFDASFAVTPAEHCEPTEAFLVLSAGGNPYAVRLSEVSGLHAGCPVTPLAGATPELLGIAGVGGRLVPVFDLGLLLGGKPSEKPRWVLVAQEAVVTFAFDGFEGHVRLPRGAVASEDRERAGRTHSGEVLRTEGGLRPILRLSSLVRAVEARQGGSGKGR